MEKMPYQEQAAYPDRFDSVRLAFRSSHHSRREGHASRGSRKRCAGAAGHADERGSGRVRIAAAAHGRRLRGIHRRGASRADARQQLLLRHRARGLRRCDGAVPGAATRARIRQRGMGICDRLAVLGPRRIRRRRESRHRFLVRRGRRARLEARSIASNGRGKRAAERSERCRKAPCAGRFSATAATSIRFSGRSSRTTGARRKRYGVRSFTETVSKISCATSSARLIASSQNTGNERLRLRFRSACRAHRTGARARARRVEAARSA